MLVRQAKSHPNNPHRSFLHCASSSPWRHCVVPSQTCRLGMQSLEQANKSAAQEVQFFSSDESEQSATPSHFRSLDTHSPFKHRISPVKKNPHKTIFHTAAEKQESKTAYLAVRNANRSSVKNERFVNKNFVLFR